MKRYRRSLVLFLTFVILFELLVILVQELIEPPAYLLGIDNLFVIFGFFMMILIALELLESIRAYLTEDALHVEVVFLVAMIAIARKVIILEVRDLEPLRLVGIASIILALAAGYYFVKLAMRKPPPPHSMHPPE